MEQLSKSTLNNASSPQENPKTLSRRRLMGQVVIGGAAALVLSACGGGGGSDGSGDTLDLVAAFDRLQLGMTWEEAKKAVGTEPNSGLYSWSSDVYLLQCALRFEGETPYLDGARLSGGGLERDKG